jgi:hypothetical protein
VFEARKRECVSILCVRMQAVRSPRVLEDNLCVRMQVVRSPRVLEERKGLRV